MTTHYADPVSGVLNTSGQLTVGDGALIGPKIHAIVSQIDLSAHTIVSGDTIVWGGLPKGAVPLYGVINASATLGASATVDVGTDATAAKFRAAGVFTAAAPTLFMKNAAVGAALAASGKLQSVVAVADLPVSGTVSIVFLYTAPHGG